MALIFSFLKKYKVAAIAALVMMLIELTVELSQPLIISKIIDLGIREKDTSVVWLWGSVLIGSAVVAFTAGVLSSFFAAHASQSFAFDLRDKLYEKVQSFTYEVFNRFATSSLITRLTGDVSQLQDTIFMSLRFMTRVPLVVVGSVIMALVVHVKLGLLLTVALPLLIFFLYWIMRKASLLFRTVQQRLDGVNGVIQENLTGIRLIRVFVRMGYEIERFTVFSGNLMRSTVSALRLTETTMPFVMLIVNAAILAILWFGRIAISSGDATLGQTVAVINYSLRTIGALTAISGLVVTFSRARASSQRVSEVMEAGAGVREGGTLQGEPIQGHVKFEGVCFKYPNSDISVLEDIHFEVAAGERVAIMGATGSGKSSLVSLIPRLYEETDGTIWIDGEKSADIDISRLRKSIGYVPQELQLFSGSIRDNIAWGNEHATLEQIQQAAGAAQIHETVKGLPDGYDTMLGQRGVNLSGGQKQRLTIARALVRKPAMLILDDSTSALDAVTEGLLLEALKDISCTTFLITQKISSTASADLILLLDEGRLIGKGSHKELMASSELYRKIYESQVEEAKQHVQSIN
ncbi:ABC transporter ATP-binding protein [Paenibacillus odorifer]|uniref:ABC transporter ATP-binding protein n=1 Tax=Paenibacillus TaxID=44249 RepID=UPI00096F2C8F|nr:MULTISPECIES: ABC transporter ATP-binding protein [Paenibacillus]MDH6429634.1 ATP-binding cassette subfamily B multidrug efflux pump [Paenibacillus sp. PastH-4]MDH6446268.1 ATP-binding cassette subfamily B multidrug efflux pump [Paenibacillus sp. PastF-4]MDH6530264.1 ATP-binding cassette subfamily B multidrug efflux pump [Paenibacillus sp. PastH-3]OMD64017.1 ABC transporter ATP-binding protein [Paenibacillus odorifer]OMD74204.1 ABC transporter ATP-binding protein [Paenibacillus odorifer]